MNRKVQAKMRHLTLRHFGRFILYRTSYRFTSYVTLCVGAAYFLGIKRLPKPTFSVVLELL